ncbi:MAG: hypothetical protein DRQ55_04865 [Planctomycetota bacterium]|nr:MAG: hypothetical protein DRQ55_04865 [Planctomycetota bacterium]
MSRLITLLSCVALCGFALPVRAQDTSFTPPKLSRGLELFARHCAPCHGADGDATGFVADLLRPRPRAFGEGTFKIVSTTHSMPHDEDFMQVLRDGMPGTAMPAFGHLAEADLRDLVAAVRHMLLLGRMGDERMGDERGDGERAHGRSIEHALELLDPGVRLELPPEPRRTPLTMTRGREVFMRTCAHCHDADGRGALRHDFVDNRGLPILARDFTRGLFKGGSASDDLARRIRLGMPGTPMPAVQLSDADLWAVVHYLQALIEPGVQEHLRQRRRLITALRVDGRLDAHAHEADWRRAPEVFVPLMPLQWRRDFPEGIRVRALHDGQRLALRLEWPDELRDDSADGLVPDDGVAVQLSPLLDPPFFGMGADDASVAILQWRASWQRELPGAQAARPVLSPGAPGPGGERPRRSDGSDLASLGHGLEARWPVREASANGPGELHGVTASRLDARGRGLRDGQGWSVVLYRELSAADEGFALGPGDIVSAAFALWDGGADDTGARKSITIWHHLLLEE